MIHFNREVSCDAAFALFSLFHFSLEEVSVVAGSGYVFVGTILPQGFEKRPDRFDDSDCTGGSGTYFMGRRIGNLLWHEREVEEAVGECGISGCQDGDDPILGPSEEE
ncbi:hypothetical protein CJF32_00010520 [Rutstroemia sp. NJR-2017a WRK4]|nr:hypothetical protein CJF32_00010520 [Rutstroemia sp. NJR-2017a WRK4]